MAAWPANASNNPRPIAEEKRRCMNDIPNFTRTGGSVRFGFN
jgi:hypothetical protein